MKDLKYNLEHEAKVTELKLKRRFTKKEKRKFINGAMHRQAIYTKVDSLNESIILSKEDFYKSQAWKQLRYRAIKEMGNVCMGCGASPRTGAVIQVDHIKPRSLYIELSLDIDNLQILCRDCNEGKSNKDATDWGDGGNKVVILRKAKQG